MANNDRIGIGILGAGSVARRIHIPGFRLCPRAELVTAFDPEVSAAEAAAIPHVSRGEQEVLEHPGVHAVVISSPNHLHHRLALAAIESGKHVLCEKPLALNARQALEMYEAARKAGCVHMTAFTYQFTPSARYLKKLVEQGELGEIRSVRAAYLMALSTHLLGWRSRAELAGSGVLADIGSHLLHLLRWIAGEFESFTASKKRFREDPSSDVEDWVGALAQLRNGACATIEISRICAGRGADISEEMFVEVYGSRGSAVFSLQEPRRLRVCLGERAADPESPMEWIEVPREEWKLPGAPREADEGEPRWSYRYDQAFQFVESVRSGQPRTPSFEDGWRCQQGLDAILESCESGRWAAIPA